MEATVLRALFTVIALCASIQSSEVTKPNIVIIVADDLGFDDVSFRGSNEFLTPNIDALGYHGVILNKFYVPAMCTPSRAALMTGRYPTSTGMQHYVIKNTEPWGLGLDETTIGEVFKANGYSTNIIGKWHLGYFKKKYTPTLRGFDQHYGYYGAFVDYWDRTLQAENLTGYDFRRNTKLECDGNGTYVTDLFTNEAIKTIKNHPSTSPLFLLLNHLAPHCGNDREPLQAPDEVIRMFSHIKDKKRQIYAAMVYKLDESIGKIVEALGQKGILDNTIILFYSDNGAPVKGMHSNSGSNFPLKGQKNSPWEGGIRSSAAIWSSRLKQRQRVWNQPMHVTDVLPTLAAAAGISAATNFPLDGRSFWDQIVNVSAPSARSMVHNIDDLGPYVSYTDGPWKYVNGTCNDGLYDDWLSHRSLDIDPKSERYEEEISKSRVSFQLAKFAPLTSDTIKTLQTVTAIQCSDVISPCDPTQGCLFNIDDDPCEQNNLAGNLKYDVRLKEIIKDVEKLRSMAKPPRNMPVDVNSYPELHHGVWTSWQDEPEVEDFCT